jgi:hypothetical protein
MFYERWFAMASPKEDLVDWVVDNLEEALLDDLSKVANPYIKLNGWDLVEIDLMLEEMVGTIKEGVLNVIETYEDE